jgi:hypothetical protein
MEGERASPPRNPADGPDDLWVIPLADPLVAESPFANLTPSEPNVGTEAVQTNPFADLDSGESTLAVSLNRLRYRGMKPQTRTVFAGGVGGGFLGLVGAAAVALHAEMANHDAARTGLLIIVAGFSLGTILGTLYATVRTGSVDIAAGATSGAVGGTVSVGIGASIISIVGMSLTFVGSLVSIMCSGLLGAIFSMSDDRAAERQHIIDMRLWFLFWLMLPLAGMLAGAALGALGGLLGSMLGYLILLLRKSNHFPTDTRKPPSP